MQFFIALIEIITKMMDYIMNASQRVAVNLMTDPPQTAINQRLTYKQITNTTVNLYLVILFNFLKNHCIILFLRLLC